MPEKITFDYFIRKAGIVTLVVLAILIVKYLGAVIAQFGRQAYEKYPSLYYRRF